VRGGEQGLKNEKEKKNFLTERNFVSLTCSMKYEEEGLVLAAWEDEYIITKMWKVRKRMELCREKGQLSRRTSCAEHLIKSEDPVCTVNAMMFFFFFFFFFFEKWWLFGFPRPAEWFKTFECWEVWHWFILRNGLVSTPLQFIVCNAELRLTQTNIPF
jgi:hypothetical protein